MVYWNKNTDLSDVYPTVKTRVKNCKYLPRTITKAGIILYTHHEDEIVFGLGLENVNHDIVDFSVNIDSIDNIFDVLLKNLNMQLLNIFEVLQTKDIMDCPVLYDKQRLICFVHLNADPDEISERFIKIYNEDHNICCVTWFTITDFNHNVLNKNNFDQSLKDFLFKVQEFLYLL